jgi:hypothetical protein
MEFTEQKVSSSFVRRNDVMIDITIESVSEESVKKFDKLAMNPVEILWGVPTIKEVFPILYFLYFIYLSSRSYNSPISRHQGVTACVKRQLVLETLL